jgi:hypothetical protein
MPSGQPPGIQDPSIVGAAVGLAPVQPTFAVQALIVFGMVMGVTGVGSLFAVSGAVAGAALGVLAGTPAKAAAEATRA